MRTYLRVKTCLYGIFAEHPCSNSHLIFSDIDGDNVITKDELKSYLEQEQHNKQLTLLCNCLLSFSFISNLTWFIGAIGYAVAYYTEGTANLVGNKIGSVGYFLGGLAYAFMTFEAKKDILESSRKLKTATTRKLRSPSIRFMYFPSTYSFSDSDDGEEDGEEMCTP